MYQIEPKFHQDFHCIAQDCQDTCCAGWAVMVDDDSAQRYRQDDSPFGRHRQSLLEETPDGTAFAMGSDGRCPFLRPDNLCEMIVAQGAASLCQICTDHPRFFNDYGGYEEAGIGLCCEEGSRLLLAAPLSFVIHQIGDAPTDPLAETLFHLRNTCQEIALDTGLSLEERAEELVDFAHQAHCQLYGDVDASQPMKWQDLLKNMGKMIPIDQGWTGYFQTLTDALPQCLSQEEGYRKSPDFPHQTYANVLGYLLYRHVPATYWDGLFYQRILWAVNSLGFLHLCFLHHWCTQGALPLDAQSLLVKNWSKQVEYCDENVALWLQASSL